VTVNRSVDVEPGVATQPRVELAESLSTRQPLTSKLLPSLLRVRKSVTALNPTEVDALRSGISEMLALSDDRGFEYWAGIHGLPLPISCTHGTPLFLPWHRAYLYFFEQYLLDQESSVCLPWWDWSTQQGIPDIYSQGSLPNGQANPLASAPISGIPDNQFQSMGETPIARTSRAPGTPDSLPSAADVASVLALDDFTDFTTQLEGLHDQVHVWVGGTMSQIPVAAFDPVFWAHHTMIDRLWAIWQQSHPGAGVGSVSLNTALGPFPTLTVGQTLSIATLGYQYAASSSSAMPMREQ
jgi:tyrosinase